MVAIARDSNTLNFSDGTYRKVHEHVLAPLQRYFVRGCRLLGASVASLLVGGVVASTASVVAFVIFWVVRQQVVPQSVFHYPLSLQLPPPRAPAARHTMSFTGDRHGGEGSSQLHGNTHKVGPLQDRALQVWEESSIRMPSSEGDDAMWDDGVACARVAINNVSLEQYLVDVDLTLVIPSSAAQRFATCAVWLLSLQNVGKRVELVSGSRPVLFRERHWVASFWRSLFWSPFVMLGLVGGDEDEVFIKVVDSFRLPQHLATMPVDIAHVCLRPGLPTSRADLRLHLSMSWPWRAVQQYPWLCSISVALLVGGTAWAMVGCCAFTILCLAVGCTARTEGTVRPNAASFDRRASDATSVDQDNVPVDLHRDPAPLASEVKREADVFELEEQPKCNVLPVASADLTSEPANHSDADNTDAADAAADVTESVLGSDAHKSIGEAAEVDAGLRQRVLER